MNDTSGKKINITYIDRLNNFWVANKVKKFTPMEHHLFGYMLDIFNVSRNSNNIWPSTITRETKEIIGEAKMTYYHLNNARKGLQERGFLYFKTKSGSKTTVYSLDPFPVFSNYDQEPDDTPPETSSPEQSRARTAKSSQTPPSPADIPAAPARTPGPKGGVIRRQPISNSSPPEVYDPDGDHPPDDGVKRNWEGLKGRLRDINCPPDVAKKVVQWSNYGLIGHKVWGILNKIRDDKGLKMPVEYLVSKMNTS
ncbi:MAG: hypothetical protein LBS20_11860 [Prevotella sp.]|jgi:hypothetical protein|nr:hypothetical protein [Prevotella sp.]